MRTLLERHVSSVAIYDDGSKSFKGSVDVLDISRVAALLSLANAWTTSISGTPPTFDEFAAKLIPSFLSSFFFVHRNSTQRTASPQDAEDF